MIAWDSAQDALACNPLNEKKTLRFALQPAEFKLFVLDKNIVSAEFPMAGRTQAQAGQWIGNQLTVNGLDANRYRYDPEQLEVAFSPAPDEPFTTRLQPAFKEMSAWFANADLVLKPVAAQYKNASPVRCWPHHFDIAALITLHSDPDAEKITSIGVGMTPGDSNYTEPYFYVTPWPYPNAADSLPALDGDGFWHTKNWIGAVLTASQIVNISDAEQQKHLVTAFLRSAIKSCQKLLS